MQNSIVTTFAVSVLFVAGCGDTQGAAGSASAASSAKPAPTASAKPTAAATASAAPSAAPSAAGMPAGAMPVAKLIEAVKADAKGAAGQKVSVDGVYWGMSTETSGTKKTYVLEIVASKTDNTDNKILCKTSDEPKDLPSADNQAHSQAIAVTVSGTLDTSSTRPALTDCTYKKK